MFCCAFFTLAGRRGRGGRAKCRATNEGQPAHAANVSLVQIGCATLAYPNSGGRETKRNEKRLYSNKRLVRTRTRMTFASSNRKTKRNKCEEGRGGRRKGKDAKKRMIEKRRWSLWCKWSLLLVKKPECQKNTLCFDRKGTKIKSKKMKWPRRPCELDPVRTNRILFDFGVKLQFVGL